MNCCFGFLRCSHATLSPVGCRSTDERDEKYFTSRSGSRPIEFISEIFETPIRNRCQAFAIVSQSPFFVRNIFFLFLVNVMRLIFQCDASHLAKVR